MADSEINVRVTADTSDLTAKLPQAADAISDFSKDAGDSFTDLQETAEDRFKEIYNLMQASADASQQEWEKFTQPVTRAFDQTVDGVLKGTQTISQAMQRVGQNIVLSLVNDGIDQVINSLPNLISGWLFSEDAITAATAAGNAVRQALGLAAADSASESADASASGQISDNAGVAFSAAFASTAAIPLIGPELAPAAGAAAAAAALSGGLGFVGAGGLASAAGGWVVPSDQLAMVHENEMILPARYTSLFDGMANNSGASAGATHVHFNVSAIDQVSVAQFFMTNGKHIASAVSRQVRNGNQSLRQAASG